MSTKLQKNTLRFSVCLYVIRPFNQANFVPLSNLPTGFLTKNLECNMLVIVSEMCFQQQLLSHLSLRCLQSASQQLVGQGPWCKKKSRYICVWCFILFWSFERAIFSLRYYYFLLYMQNSPEYSYYSEVLWKWINKCLYFKAHKPIPMQE